MYKVSITKVETSETRVCQLEENWSNDYIWLWTDGDFSCDCNRSLFWKCAESSSELSIDESDECGSTKYRVDYIELSNGIKIDID